MAAISSILAGIGAAASAGTTIAGVVEKNKANAAQEQALKEQKESQARLEQEAKDRQANEEANALKAKENAALRAASKKKQLATQGRSSTLLTGPLGLTGASTSGGGGGKTLLGA